MRSAATALAEAAITTHDPGQFSGEIEPACRAPIAGHGRAGPDGCTRAFPSTPSHVRALMIGSAEIGEIMMRAFILRRVGLIDEGRAGSVLIGAPGRAESSGSKASSRRNGYPIHGA